MAGGGTGGHVFPALAVAAELEKRGHRVSWAGRRESMEQRLVTAAGLDFHELEARPWVGKGIRAKVGALGTLVVSTLRGRRLVRRTDAEVVLGTGGYVSTPAVLGARLAGRPAFIFEPNAQAGAANRLAARWSTRAFVAHEATARQLACETQVTGVPVRAAFHGAGPLPQGRPHLLVLGGSQGALQINELLPEVVARLLSDFELAGVTVTHQCGRAHVDAVEAAYEALGIETGTGAGIQVVPFIDDVAAEMAKAHLVVSRAGALATAELAAAGRPAVLLPLLAAGAGHQRLNAERMHAAGAALALPGDDPDCKELGGAVAALLLDRARLASMSDAARSLAHPGAAVHIADALTSIAARGTRGVGTDRTEGIRRTGGGAG